MNIAELWQKAAFILVHYTSIWLLAAFFGTALASWHLGNVLEEDNTRAKEARLAKRTAAAYVILGTGLWLFSYIYS